MTLFHFTSQNNCMITFRNVMCELEICMNFKFTCVKFIQISQPEVLYPNTPPQNFNYKFQIHAIWFWLTTEISVLFIYFWNEKIPAPTYYNFGGVAVVAVAGRVDDGDGGRGIGGDDNVGFIKLP